jgi:Na+-driven multidrug efflux pump
MWNVILVGAFALFAATVTLVSYRLGLTKTDNARVAGLIGFLLSFLPPLALIYLVVLALKQDTAIV